MKHQYKRNKDGRFKKGNKSISFWKGKKRPPQSEITKKMISEKLKGIPKSDIHKEKIRLAKLGKDNPSWKGGRYSVPSGHILIASPDHPNRNTNCRVFEHRLVMEKKIGRFLKPEEVIHHIDGEPSNNNIDNLYLTTKSGNTKAHHSINKLLKVFLKDKLIIFNKEKGIYEYIKNRGVSSL